jgi:hypothetical protein
VRHITEAEYPGFCQECEKPWATGAPIRKDADGRRWVHAACAVPRQPELKPLSERRARRKG